MLQRNARLLIGLSGIFGTILLILYFGIGFMVGLAQLAPNSTQAEVIQAATHYHTLLFMGTWLQATGSLLSVIFFLSLVHRARASTSLPGLLTILGSTTLLGVVLIEGVFTIDMAQAAVDGHQMASLTSFDVMTVFTYAYPIAPAPVIFLALGTVILRSQILPRALGTVAIGLGVAFELAGIISLFTTSLVTLIVLSLQAIWVLVAAIVWLTRASVPGADTDNLSLQSSQAL
ncbi:hypothetical protein [Dictyobacter aurantiacus]|uniref:DUF4386 domain-containing protein n=1 Tax=Dictyobacter aurantiacus TaxID=1936993 RepID=A0A401ZN44_9CHLR|nr:hypothetical protein [Dictyobacter aurantiacus]GCE08230.1 hypothetical protein KDAU_55590 [Dictyobacter aurantiacus]